MGGREEEEVMIKVYTLSFFSTLFFTYNWNEGLGLRFFVIKFTFKLQKKIIFLIFFFPVFSYL